MLVLATVLAVSAAALDRIGILQLANVAVLPARDWPFGVAQAAAAISASVLLCRWFGRIGLRTIDREMDRTLTLAVPGLRRDNEWDDGATEGQTAVVNAVRSVEDTVRLIIPAIPSLMITLLTMVWIALHNVLGFIVISACCVVASALARPRLRRQRAGQTVLEHAEARIDDLVARLLAAGPIPLVGVGPRRDFMERAVWPKLDDGARATSSFLQLQAWISALGFWLELLIIGVLILVAPPGDQGWMVSIILVAATFRPARKAMAALPAIATLQSGLAALAALPALTHEPPQNAPPRWRTLSLRRLQVAPCDGMTTMLNALGPLDLDLGAGDIVVVTGPDRLDSATLLHLLTGRVTPAAGEIRIDGHLMSPEVLRRMSGGITLGSEDPPAIAETPRARQLLARFDLPATGQSRPAMPDPISQSELSRRRFVATELQGRPLRLYDMRLLQPQPEFLEATLETFREAKAQGHLCIIATDHPELRRIADRVLHLQDGRLLPETAEQGP